MKVTARSLRSIIVSGLFLLSFTLSAPTRSLHAQDQRSGNEFDYYSDDTFTCQVGVWVWCSDGTNYRSGEVTPYAIISPSGC
jgi:hypothetical protein